MRILQFIAFITVFLGIYGSVNVYVIWRINNLLGNQFTKLTILLILFSTASYILGNLVERFAHNIFTRSFYAITATWLGVLFLLFSMLLVFEIFNLFLKIPQKQSAFVILIIVGIFSIYAIYNALNVKIKEISIPLKNLKSEVKIVQLTDLHVGTINNGDFLEKVIIQVNNLKPDFVVITGDLVDGSGPLRHYTYAKLNAIKVPIYFVMGNHETYENVDKVLEIFKDIDLKVLMNEKVEINGIELIGINFAETTKNAEANLKNITVSPNLPSILLAHNPNVIKFANQKGIDLQLSGHTHNGQILPFNLIVKLFYPYINGLYDYQGTKLYVSPGTGTWGPPMRFGSNNEITLIKLIPVSSKNN